MVKKKANKRVPVTVEPEPEPELTPEQLEAMGNALYFHQEILCPVLFAAQYEANYLLQHDVIEIREPRYNTFFSPWSNACTIFLRPKNKSSKWHCGACGKARGNNWFWTQLAPFRAGFTWGLTISFSHVLDPLTPVCTDHPLNTWPRLEDSPKDIRINDSRFV